MYYDPYDEEVQVKFHRTDQTGRIVRLDTGDDEFTGRVLRIASLVAACVLAIVAWWLA
jgi:hypothetical protein